MALERTFSIVKPDGVARDLIGEVYRRFDASILSKRADVARERLTTR